MATEHPALSLTEVGGVESSAAVAAGQAGGVVQPSPGHHSLRLVNRRLAPHTPVGILGDRPAPAVVQVMVRLPHKKYFQIARLTENFSGFVAKHRIVAETVLALLAVKTFLVENFCLRLHLFCLENFALATRTGLTLFSLDGRGVSFSTGEMRVLDLWVTMFTINFLVKTDKDLQFVTQRLLT